MTGMVTASMISWTLVGSAMRATPPSARMSAGTRSSAMTATAPASSAIFAWSAVVTSMMTPPLSISARPDLTLKVPVSLSISLPHLVPRSHLRIRLEAEIRRSPRRTNRSELDGRRGILGEQLHPGLARRQGDLLSLGVQELGHIALLVPLPAALDDLAVPENVEVVRADDLEVGYGVAGRVADPRVQSLHDHHDHVVGRDLRPVLEAVRCLVVEPQVDVLVLPVAPVHVGDARVAEVYLPALLALRELLVKRKYLGRRCAVGLAGAPERVRRGEDVVRRGVVRVARADLLLEVAVDVLDPRRLDVLDHRVHAACVHEQRVAVLLEDRGVD